MNLAYRWFCRLGIEDIIPDHSVFCRARHERFRKSDALRRVFECVVARCITAGLVRGEALSIDASLIKADVNKTKRTPCERPIAWPKAEASFAVREYLPRCSASSKAPAVAAAAQCTSSIAPAASTGGMPSSAAGALAVGIAIADKQLRPGAVTACFFGEGAADEGAFHESMNLVELRKLPALFVCGNNLYAIGAPLETAEAETDIYRKAAASGYPAEMGRRHEPGDGRDRRPPRD